MTPSSTPLAMRIVVASSFALWLGVHGHASSAMAQQGDWRLVWQDEFAGERLDYCKWDIEVNDFGGGNEELQMYTDRPENVRIDGGHLVLEARADNPSLYQSTRAYSSGRVRTKYRGDWKYGRFEVRAKLPVGTGLWPAIWMLPTEETYGPWAASGEMDIVESKGQEPAKIHGTLHYGGTWPHNQYSGGEFSLSEGTFAEDFHVFALEWDPEEIRWYVDGTPYFQADSWQSSEHPFPAPFDQPFHLVLNLAVGGRFVGPPDESTKFPQQMRVDYVRVYQRR